MSENTELRSHGVEDLEIFKLNLELVVWPILKCGFMPEWGAL